MPETTDRARAYLRRVPKQKRSIERFNHILDTAAQLFLEQGYDAVTTNHIAQAAGVAIGSVYQFFPDKEAILQALVDRFRQAMHAVMPQDVAPPRPIAEVVTELLHNVHAFQQQHAAFEHVLLSLDVVADAPALLHNDIVAWVEGLLAAQYPALPPDERHLAALCGVGIVKGMLPLWQAPHNVPIERLNSEIQAALLSYIDHFLGRAGLNADA